MALLAGGCWEPQVEARPAQCALARTVRIATEDGATVALHHHACADGPPVLLVHGISSNARFWDLDEDHSLASWLADRGHDVWLLDLRGHGEALWDADDRRQWAGWTVDDYGRYDVAAAVDHVRAVTGFATVGYVGHSMGGMVGGIYAATVGEDALASLVVVGSPSGFSKDDPLVGLAQAGFAAGGAALVWFETPALATASADAAGWGPFAVRERLYNPENFAPETVDLMMRSIVSPMTRREMQHFARMIRDERFESFDGAVDYRAALKDVQTPLLAVVGAGDHVVPPAHVRAWADAMGGETKVVEAGRAGGFQHDYGHLDLGLGQNARDEVFPEIDAWLRAHPPKR